MATWPAILVSISMQTTKKPATSQSRGLFRFGSLSRGRFFLLEPLQQIHLVRLNQIGVVLDASGGCLFFGSRSVGVIQHLLSFRIDWTGNRSS